MAGIFDLPREIWTQILNHVLRPDCAWDLPCHCFKQHYHPSHLHGCINILLTCKTIYCEGVEHLRLREREIPVSFRATAVFRHPKAIGRTGVFSKTTINATGDDKRTSCTWFPRYTELQFVSLRKVCLDVDCNYADFGYPKEMHDRLLPTALKWKLHDIAKALRKSRSMELIRLRIVRNLDYDEQRMRMSFLCDDTWGIKSGLWAIVRAAESQGCHVIIDRAPELCVNGESNDNEPLIPWLVQKAYHAGMYVERRPDLSCAAFYGSFSANYKDNKGNLVYGVTDKDLTRSPKTIANLPALKARMSILLRTLRYLGGTSQPPCRTPRSCGPVSRQTTQRDCQAATPVLT